MVFDKFSSNIKKKISDRKVEQARKKAEEEERKDSILSGQIAPVKVVVNLDPNEKAYVQLSAKRRAIVDKIVEKTVSKSKKKGTLTRAAVGGVLLGPLGAVGGAATAGSKGQSTTTQETESTTETVDNGNLILTNKRLLFVGQKIVSLPYSQLMAVSFVDTFEGKRFFIKYEGMLRDEHYDLSGTKAKDTELYYKGITGNLLIEEKSSN